MKPAIGNTNLKKYDLHQSRKKFLSYPSNPLTIGIAPGPHWGKYLKLPYSLVLPRLPYNLAVPVLYTLPPPLTANAFVRAYIVQTILKHSYIHYISNFTFADLKQCVIPLPLCHT